MATDSLCLDQAAVWVASVFGARLGPCPRGMALGGHGVQSLSLNDDTGRSSRACGPSTADMPLFHVDFPSKQPDHAPSRSPSALAGGLPGGQGEIPATSHGMELNQQAGQAWVTT